LTSTYYINEREGKKKIRDGGRRRRCSSGAGAFGGLGV
jgi:hypothetical protein